MHYDVMLCHINNFVTELHVCSIKLCALISVDTFSTASDSQVNVKLIIRSISFCDYFPVNQWECEDESSTYSVCTFPLSPSYGRLNHFWSIYFRTEMVTCGATWWGLGQLSWKQVPPGGATVERNFHAGFGNQCQFSHRIYLLYCTVRHIQYTSILVR